ncbi:ZIP family metal transporter [Candidatus Nomurabacteria bacterium]|nr:ZIP family metal transporter [Candidatus Nomurabacteria bacterium]
MLFPVVVAAIFIALLSLVGVFFYGQRGHLAGTNRYVIPLAIGVFLGVVFFELIPETIEAGGEFGSLPIVIGFISFYLLSHILHTYHHHHDHGHDDGCEEKVGATMLLYGDAIHNFADGVVIATAFFIDPAVGIATTLGVALHEIPQEIAEFGVLLSAGYSKTRAALLNLLSASSVIVGAVITTLVATSFADYLWIITGLAAGNLLYIAASDLLPDEHEESRQNGRVFQSFIATVIGLVAITLLLSWAHEHMGEHGHDHETAHENLVHTGAPD